MHDEKYGQSCDGSLNWLNVASPPTTTKYIVTYECLVMHTLTLTHEFTQDVLMVLECIVESGFNYTIDTISVLHSRVCKITINAENMAYENNLKRSSSIGIL